MSVTHPFVPVTATAVLFLVVSSAWAQSDGRLQSVSFAGPVAAVVAVTPAQQLVELTRWTHDYAEWKAWYVKWENRPEPGWVALRERRHVPEPPSWLAAICEARFEPVGPTGDACAAWREWTARSEAASVAAQQQVQARQQHEAPTKTAWFERVHVDALWPMTQAGSSTIGIAGMHATVHVTRRFQVFLAPGVMMMRVPTLTGGMTWNAATDWGFSYRLFDFRFPGIPRPSTLHFNMVRVWMVGGSPEMARPGEMYLAGFSVSFKRR